jgi:nicotinamide riboside kinase
MNPFKDVKDFHDKFGLPMEGDPHPLDEAEQKFRIKCLHEEVHEYERAVADGDLAEQFDALLDLTYFALGTAHRCNFPWDHGWSRVQEANMTKVMGENGVEIIKPEGWQAPDLCDLLELPDYYKSLKNNRGLITLDGPDGTGKTTLARRIAQLFDGEYIHLTWTPRLDRVMNTYRTNAIKYAAALAQEKVVILERPWLCHPIYSAVYRNDKNVHDWLTWRNMTEARADINIVALPGSWEHWFRDYVHNTNTRAELYAGEHHEKMLEVFNYFKLIFEAEPNALGIEPLDPVTHIRYDYQRVDPVNELDTWIVEFIQPLLGIK